MKPNNFKYNKKLEGALRESLREEIMMDRTFKKNLDKLVDNTIQSQKIAEKAKVIDDRLTRKKGFWRMMFTKAKWQTSFLISFLGVLLIGATVFAAVPELKEIVIPTKGELYVNSIPEDASVYLEGVEYSESTLVGETPFQDKIKAGDYKLRLELEGHEQYTREFKLEAGKSVNLDITLEKKYEVLETIKEWKTYADIEQGFEFTYPLSWKFTKESGVEEGKFIQVNVEGEKSQVFIYQENKDFDELEKSVEEITLSGNHYQGVKSEMGWELIIFDKVESEDGTNIIKFAFATKDEIEVSIYDFIVANFEVYNVEESDNQTEQWEIFTQDDFGFSLKYPSDWIIIERENKTTFGRYHIKPAIEEVKPLEVIYTLGYFKDLSGYLLENDSVIINGQSVKRFKSTSNEGRFLHQFPNRFFVIYELSYDHDIDEAFREILESFNVESENMYEQVIDYTFNYSITIPDDWSYGNVTGYSDFDGTEITINNISSTRSDIYIMKWEDVRDKWMEHVDGLDLENSTVIKSDIKINAGDYERWEIWKVNEESENAYYIKEILYLPKVNDIVSAENPVISVGEEEYVIIATSSTSVYESIESVSDEDRLEFEIVDAIVAGIIPIE